MINTTQLLQDLKNASSALFVSNTQESKEAAEIYHHLLQNADSSFWLQQNLRLMSLQLNVEPLDSYRICGVDGSQIYPDRHEGWACGLLHAGLVDISYAATSSIQFHTWQQLVLPEDVYNTAEFIDARRQELELASAVAHTQRNKPDILLCDGSLLFWHLESFSESVKEEFLGKYLNLSYLLYQQQVPVIGYTSLPNSKDLVDVVNAYAKKIMHQNENTFETIKDRDFLWYALAPQAYSPLFEFVHDLTSVYPAALKPYVLYFNAGNEIARLEIPAWIVQQPDLLNRLLTIVQDQVVKGDGYPLVLAEAHELTVIKAADRHHFYQLLSLHAQHQGMVIPNRSKKLQKKQRMRV